MVQDAAPAGPSASSSWPERWRDLRVRLIADPRFQRFASGFPPTRWIARRKGRTLFDLCAGFVYSQVLVAFVRFRLAERLAEGAKPAEDLAAETGLTAVAMDRLLRATTALGLTRLRRGGRYGLDDLGAALLGNAGVAEMIEHHAALYADLADPAALLRGGVGEAALERYWGYGTAQEADALGQERVASYSELMAASVPMIADDVLDAFPLEGRRLLMDVGGGTGRFAATALQRYPGLKARVVDLPAVASLAGERFAAEGLADRAETVGLNFHADPLPAGADVASLIRVCFDHDDARVAALLHRVRQALPAGGRLLLAEVMSDETRPNRVGDAYFGFYLLAMGRGRCRSVETLSEMLRSAGFKRVREVAMRRPMLARLLVAEV